ncbi:MAG: HAMP domain-containing histidine kinase [Melioribacteraceae bacterium]|nr:HAMP domain-containing histidine kinase [Melioribacteraceae bacterium]
MNLEQINELVNASDNIYLILDKSYKIEFHSDNFKLLLNNSITNYTNKNLQTIGLNLSFFEKLKTIKEDNIFEIYDGESKWYKWNVKFKNDKIYLVGENISGEKIIKKKLSEQISLESKILIFAKNFISLPISQIDDHIYFSLKIIGELIGADAVYLIKDGDSELFWCSEKYENAKNRIIETALEYVQQNSKELEVNSIYLNNKNISDVNSSKLILPLLYNGVIFGFLCFETFKKNMILEEEIINHLKLFTTILTSALKRLEAETEIKKAFEREIDLNEIKSRFISTASHEFRTPLTAVLSSTEVLEMLLENPNRRISERHIENIKDSVSFLNGLIEDVLTVTKVDSGKLVFYPEEFDFKKFCDGIYQEFFLSGEEIKILDYKYACKKRKYKLDIKLLRKIIANLLSNAIKYAGKGSIINFWIEEKETKIIVTIIDNGIGIPKKDQESLFEPFFRAGNIKNVQGHGLGLSIVKKAVELHNGEIEYFSEEDKGTKFIVKIPVN